MVNLELELELEIVLVVPPVVRQLQALEILDGPHVAS